MGAATPILTSFNAGELEKTLDGRTDLQKYAQGCKLLENFMPIVQGPLVRRGGSRYVSGTKTQSVRSWIRRFEFSATQAYLIEFGNQYVRFYTLHGVVLSGGPPYEVVSPYDEAHLTNPDGTCALSITQSGDVLYIGNMYRTIKPQKLTRLGATNWVFSEYRPKTGPLIEMNDTTTSIYASAQTGSVTLEASSGIFAATDVGRLVRLEPQHLNVHPWEQDKAYIIGDLVRSNAKTYKALNAKTSGSSPPIHEYGQAYDGKDGVLWEYQDSGYGMVRLTGFTDADTVTGDVVVDQGSGLLMLPVGVVGSGSTTKRWTLGAWSDTTGYPGVVEQWRGRLAWFQGQRYAISVPADFENMSADFFGIQSADCAIWDILQSEDVNDVNWACECEKKLLVGTPGGEFALGEITSSDPLGPGNIEALRQTRRRSRAIRPMVVDSAVIFIQRAGRRMLSMDFDVAIDKFKTTDLAVLARHITRSGIIDMAYQAEPYSQLWCVLGNGLLAALTLDQEQNVIGWHRHPIGGSAIVESVAVIPAPSGDRDEVWIQARRSINGSTKRYVEYIERPWEFGDPQADAFYVDSGLTYSGAPTMTITGLDHLEGEVVQVLADGARHPDRTVVAGAITLQVLAILVHVGKKAPARMISMRLEAGAQQGTSQGKTKRVHQVTVRLLDALGGQVGVSGCPLSEIQYRDSRVPMGSPPAIVESQDFPMPVESGYERECRIEVLQDQPFPMTIAAVIPELRTYE
jgi:hypothetical protein